MVLKTALALREQSFCRNIPADSRAGVLCRNFFMPGVNTTEEEYQRAIPQTKNENVLLMNKGHGQFTDQAIPMGVDTTGWSWNAKIADLDSDGWQDIYVVNGTWQRRDTTTSNFFFHNEEGERFSDRTEEYGLDDFMVVSSYTYIDIDNDGDLDIVTSAVNGTDQDLSK